MCTRGSICALRLAVVAALIISLAQHHTEIAHRRLPLHRHRISLGCKTEAVFLLSIPQSFGYVGKRVVQRQHSYRQFRLFGCLSALHASGFLRPFLLLLGVDVGLRLQFVHPGTDYRVKLSLSRTEFAADVGDEIQSPRITVHIQFHARSQSPECRSYADEGSHTERRSGSSHTVAHAHRQFRQSVKMPEFILLHGLVQGISHLHAFLRISASRLEIFLSQRIEHIFQSFRHLRSSFSQSRVNAFHLLFFRKPVVAGNHPIHEHPVESAYMPQVHREFKSQHISVRGHRRFPVVIHPPPFLNNHLIRYPQVILSRRRGRRRR